MLRRLSSITVYILILIVIAVSLCYGQKIVCKVEIMLEKMPLENQTKLKYLQDELASYINDYDWSENEFQYDINCELAVAFDEAKTVSYEDRYTATIIITNGIDLQYADKRWTFALKPNESLNHSSSFHPFTSLLDFYINLLLAYEYDKLNEFGGDKYYDAAYQINEIAKFNTQHYRGWDRRSELITDLRDERQKPYRKLVFHYFAGYYFFEAGDSENAAAHLMNAVRLVKSIPKNELERFFEVNHFNFLKALKKLKMFEEAKYLETFKPQ